MPLNPPPEEAQPEKGPQVHKIVDGDTLNALAERYLGSSGRAIEIFEANRNVLNDPELLPIGVELKIPEK
jgi:nucleoid-associated protein YgaU